MVGESRNMPQLSKTFLERSFDGSALVEREHAAFLVELI